MNSNYFYQRFCRIINNQRQSYSSKDLSSTLGTPKFYESYCNYIMYQLNNFVLKKMVCERNPNSVDEINQYLSDLYVLTPRGDGITIDKPVPVQPTRTELSAKELLQRRSGPMYYTINEEIKILEFGVEEFKIWFKNEIIVLLDLIELYKKNNIIYYVPKSIYSIHRSPVITTNQSIVDLDNELYSCYKRIICLYSVITTDVVQNKNKKKGLFKELNFIKVFIEVLTYQMDAENVRIDNFISELIKHYPRTSFGSQSSMRLRDVVMMPEEYFVGLGEDVANCLINLL
uniref:Mediator of RNA polymerase II transcription subunit 7 n=1 Tax=Strongyloides venezuelensis TaxID=75913 RepID=A0A0K0G255_STRVS